MAVFQFSALSDGQSISLNPNADVRNSTGQLFYDADGSGAGGAQLVATFQGTPAIAATDITVI